MGAPPRIELTNRQKRPDSRPSTRAARTGVGVRRASSAVCEVKPPPGHAPRRRRNLGAPGAHERFDAGAGPRSVRAFACRIGDLLCAARIRLRNERLGGAWWMLRTLALVRHGCGRRGHRWRRDARNGRRRRRPRRLRARHEHAHEHEQDPVHGLSSVTIDMGALSPAHTLTHSVPSHSRVYDAPGVVIVVVVASPPAPPLAWPENGTILLTPSQLTTGGTCDPFQFHQ